jgi:hypothetical protein
MAKKIKRTQGVADTLHCWNVPNWPEQIYPGNADSGRHLVQSNRDALVEAGALIRYGRELVVIGVPYVAWLKTHTKGVKDIEMPCNAPEVKANRAKTTAAPAAPAKRAGRNGKDAHP